MSYLLLLSLSACWLSCTTARSAPPYALEQAELHFENFIQQYDKQYANEDEKQARFQIFKDNLKEVNNLNEKSDHTIFGITKFMDLTRDEFQTMTMCIKKPDNVKIEAVCKYLSDNDIPDVDAPESFDWRDQNAVGPIKNQDSCGSCYAFSTTGNIEGQYAIKNKKHLMVSEQQIVDCDRRSHGCNGGFMSYSLRSLIEMEGSESEADYPYTHVVGSCNFDKSKVKVRISDCRSYNLTSQEKLKQLVYQTGPIAIAVYATNFHLYRGGVMTDDFCGTGYVNHGVLLVGYGVENGQDFWIIKNSWAETFGEGGYLRVQRGETCTSCMLMNDLMASAILA